MLKVAINEAPDSPQRKRTKKVMSRIEWIMQLKNVFSTLITTFNQEYFKKEIITNMIQGREPVYTSLRFHRAHNYIGIPTSLRRSLL